MSKKDTFLTVYDNIQNKKKKYYVPLIKSNNEMKLEDVFTGTERLFFLENGLYFVSETVIDAYKKIFPSSVQFFEVKEGEFNLILDDICATKLPTKAIAIVEDDKSYIVEKSTVLVNWIYENFENVEKPKMYVKYIDSEKDVVSASVKNKPTSKEKLVVGSVVTILLLLKILYLYVSYIFSFNVLALTGVWGIVSLIIVFIFLNTLSDIAVKGLLDNIIKDVKK